MSNLEINNVNTDPKFGSRAWWIGGSEFRPLVVLGLLIFLIAMVLMPAPQGLLDLMVEENPQGAKLQSRTTTYVDSFNKLMKADFTAEEVA